MDSIPYGKHTIDQEDIDAVIDILKNKPLTTGPAISSFENNVCQKFGAKYGVAVSNGTAALHLAVASLGVPEGKVVLVTANSFAASSNCVLYEGGIVDFVDIDPLTGLMDLEKLEEALIHHKGRVAGIIGVDYAGQPLDWVRLRSLADQNSVWLIQDGCHSPGASYHGHKVGCGEHADVTAFSFHPVKHIAAGEGGMLLTNKKEVFEKSSLLRTHGITGDPLRCQLDFEGPWHKEMQILGFNYRLTDIQAALGTSQLNKLEWSVKRRREIAERYRNELEGVQGFSLLKDNSYAENSYHLFVLRTSKRKELNDFLNQNNIFPQVHYRPIYLHPYYKGLGFRPGLCPEAESFYNECLSLPMFPALLQDEQAYTIEKIKEFYA